MSYTNGLDKPTDYFNTKLYTGDGTAIGSGGHAITGIGFQPDWVWIKARSTTHSHRLFDSVRGINKGLLTNSTNAEQTSTEQLNSFDSDGYTYGSHDSGNENNTTYVAWNWLAGGTASSNTDGSITSSVSANTTAGFSIVSYTGNGTAGATVGHGLGVKPSMMIIKTRESLGNWVVFHGTQPATKYIELNGTGALGTSTAPFNDTEPTSSVFTLGTWSNTNDNGNGMIAYCFAEKKGFSKFGSYSGNGSSDGSFIFTGFKPAWVMVKKTNSSGDEWNMFDNKRDVDNVIEKRLVANINGADAPSTYLDFLSNGFKWRTSNNLGNGSGNTYIYMAFSESPFVTSTGIPTVAR